MVCVWQSVCRRICVKKMEDGVKARFFFMLLYSLMCGGQRIRAAMCVIYAVMHMCVCMEKKRHCVNVCVISDC